MADLEIVLNVVLSSIVALYCMMLAMWRRYPAAGIIAITFIVWIAAYLFLVWTGATEGIMQ